MVFNSLHFLWFFVVVYALYRVLPHRGAELAAARRQLLLLRGVGLALPRPAARLDAGRLHVRAALIERPATPRRRAARCSALSLGFNLTLLGFFKYFNFFADNLHALFGALGWQLDFVTLRVLLPVGISFYTFVTMSYVIDVYRREIPADARTCVDFAVFVAYFPHLVAGPILRASRLLPQIHNAAHDHRASRCATARG